MSIRKLYNSLVSDPNDGDIKYARDEEYNIIISDCTVRSLLPRKLKKSQQDTRSSVFVNVAFMLNVYIHNCYTDVVHI